MANKSSQGLVRIWPPTSLHILSRPVRKAAKAASNPVNETIPPIEIYLLVYHTQLTRRTNLKINTIFIVITLSKYPSSKIVGIRSRCHSCVLASSIASVTSASDRLRQPLLPLHTTFPFLLLFSSFSFSQSLSLVHLAIPVVRSLYRSHFSGTYNTAHFTCPLQVPIHLNRSNITCETIDVNGIKLNDSLSRVDILSSFLCFLLLRYQFIFFSFSPFYLKSSSIVQIHPNRKN